MIARATLGTALMLAAEATRQLSPSRAAHPTRCWADRISSYSAAPRRRHRGSRWNAPARPRWSDKRRHSRSRCGM